MDQFHSMNPYHLYRKLLQATIQMFVSQALHSIVFSKNLATWMSGQNKHPIFLVKRSQASLNLGKEQPETQYSLSLKFPKMASG